MGESSKEARAKAELRFRQRARAESDRTRAMDEYVVEAEKRRTKTARLKALRLAKEATEAKEQAAAKAAPPKKKAARRSPKK